MSIYTREGDDGTTALAGGKRLPKHHPRIEAFGMVDELVSWIGLLRDQKENYARREVLLFIQDELMACSCSLASDPDDTAFNQIIPHHDCVSRLELEIDDLERRLTPLNSFIVPGGHQVVSYCHIARCVCRRAERAVNFLKHEEFVPEIIIKFLNRLSDYLFVLSRSICLELDIEEVKWHK
jgi:cob(I)alamin adenosyltransferase